jgi:hypothetical protein
MDNNNIETNNSYYQDDTVTTTSEINNDDKTQKSKVTKGGIIGGSLACVGTFIFVSFFGFLGLIFLAIAAVPIGAITKTKLPFALKIILDIIIAIIAIVLYFIVVGLLSGV